MQAQRGAGIASGIDFPLSDLCSSLWCTVAPPSNFTSYVLRFPFSVLSRL